MCFVYVNVFNRDQLFNHYFARVCIGRKEMFYLMMHLTHFIYGYMVSDIWLRTILIVRKETRCRYMGYSYWLAARFFLMHHPTDRIAHTTAFVTPVVEHWLEWEIAQWVHPMKNRSDDPSQNERMLLPRSYISLPLPVCVYLQPKWLTHKWYSKHRCVFLLHIKELLLLTGNSSPWWGGSGLHFSISVVFKQVLVKCVECVVK